MRRDPRYLNVNEHIKICGEHFVIEDYLNPYSVKKRQFLRGIKIKISLRKDASVKKSCLLTILDLILMVSP